MKALVDLDLKRLIEKKIFHSKNKLIDYIQPASIDLPLGDKAYLVKQKFLPFSQDVSSMINNLCVEEISLKKGATLFKGQTYLVQCLDVNLPENLIVKVSPKSSIGRIDLLVRSVFDNLGLYDTILPSSKGQLWLEISPHSFNVKVYSGMALSQLRVFDEDKSILGNVPQMLFNKKGEMIETRILDENKMILSLDVEPNSHIGYVSKQTNQIIDLSNEEGHDWRHFFKKINIKKSGKCTLEKDKFYILLTKEKISVPTKYSVEMIPFSHLVGELRVHYAGFFDPGWGYPKGVAGVLEIRPHETLTIYDGQPICMIEFFENKSKPKFSYGERDNHYHFQVGPKLAKYFKSD